MKRANQFSPKLLLVSTVAILTTGLANSAAADYQQTLAARGADAFTPTSAIIAIEQDDLQETFANSSLLAGPALSDQEVMVDLQQRMNANNHLEQAAANLAPEAVAEVVAEVVDGVVPNTVVTSSGTSVADADPVNTGDNATGEAAAVASR